MRRPERKSKIVCTIGPACDSLEALTLLIEKGMDVARLNFSHGTHKTHQESIQKIRLAATNLGIPVGILIDLQGPKIRTGTVEKNSIEIKAGQEIYATSNPQFKLESRGSLENPLYISYAALEKDLKKNEKLLLDDGLIALEVVEASVDMKPIKLRVLYGESIASNKGVNFPSSQLSTTGITEKDWKDIQFAMKEDIDFFALSFVRSEKEVRYLKDFLKENHSQAQIISKIEKAEALENIESIIDASDGIMIARGDLGVEIGNEKVPLIQKRLIQMAHQKAKPVITATQMLMSMVKNPSPSRAEASDIANAVIDGSDALMLSNETATGTYPHRSVEVMDEIIKEAEKLEAPKNLSLNARPENLSITEAIESSAVQMSKEIKAGCIACFTQSGESARFLAKNRPIVSIFAFSTNKFILRQLCLSWGISPIPWKGSIDQEYSLFDDLMHVLKSLSLIKDGKFAILTAGIPTIQKAGSTNTLVVKKA